MKSKHSSRNLFLDKIGRQRSIVIATILFLFGSAIQTGAKNLAMILFGRFAAGCKKIIMRDIHTRTHDLFLKLGFSVLFIRGSRCLYNVDSNVHCRNINLAYAWKNGCFMAIKYFCWHDVIVLVYK